jgi:hypothetical protein
MILYIHLDDEMDLIITEGLGLQGFEISANPTSSFYN